MADALKAGPYPDGGQSRVAVHSPGEKGTMKSDKVVETSFSASVIHGLLFGRIVRPGGSDNRGRAEAGPYLSGRRNTP